MQTPLSSFPSHRYLRLLLVATAIGACLFAIRSAAAFGVSRLLATYSLGARSFGAAKKAVELTPKDAEAHFARAVVLGMSDTPGQSVPELEQAVALRPADYTLWQQLGLLRDQAGDRAGAVAAFDESIRRAPSYSQPRWNRGNVLLRSGQYESAFVDLNQAAQSNPDLIPILIDLAWGISRGDVKLTEELTKINGDKMRLAFAKLLARRGKGQDALAQLRSAGNVPEAVRNELIDQLLAKSAFKEAFEIWKGAPGFQSQNEQAGPSIYDGGFEGSLSFGESGFGWRVPRDLQATSISLDSGEPHSGSKNLRIEFSGNSNPNVSQLILLEPARHYRINFASRSQDVVTGGLPLLVVSDAAGDSKRLGQSAPLAKGTSEWQSYSFEFTTTPATTAVVLSLQRESCTTSPCPIFGSISLDSFSVEQLKMGQ
ncbi:MAG TPA: tetratricopeptide repeat protein [Pyrinomonadaceae bacterium]|nr:tetratricopeptide repeat protein [Pyrinomonadaceae bacterium]